jgi:hypothetical protein
MPSVTIRGCPGATAKEQDPERFGQNFIFFCQPTG